MTMKRREAIWGLILASPIIIWIAVLFVFPFLFSGYVSFTSWNLFHPPRFTGLRNWRMIFGDRNFWSSLRNVFYFAAIFVPLQTFLALVFAYFLNRSFRGRSVFRAIFFLPAVTPWVAIALIFKFIFARDLGILNHILTRFGFERIDWLGSIHFYIAIGTVAIIQVWKGVGQSMLLLLAGMQNVSREHIEAAEIDGANRNQIFFRIVVPLTTPMIFLVMIMSTISAFTAFDGFLALFSADNLRPERMVTNLYIYTTGFIQGSYGKASAAAWALFAVILAITGLQKAFEKRWVHYET